MWLEGGGSPLGLHWVNVFLPVWINLVFLSYIAIKSILFLTLYSAHKNMSCNSKFTTYGMRSMLPAVLPCAHLQHITFNRLSINYTNSVSRMCLRNLQCCSTGVMFLMFPILPHIVSKLKFPQGCVPC